VANSHYECSCQATDQNHQQFHPCLPQEHSPSDPPYNPGGSRLNQALHMATIARMTHDRATRAYVERRRAEGRTTKEIRRILKRYLARQLYRALNAFDSPPLTT